ncbi:N-myristoyl transferase [Flagelloscypha sp. PMI_526]|nr:N-myristoyl transferase [Flagelloscypha sp. PMI_526]
MSESKPTTSEIIDTTVPTVQDNGADSSGEDEPPNEGPSTSTAASTSTSSSNKKKKKKKKSNLAKAVDALRGQHIPDAAVEAILEKVKLDPGVPAEEATAENVRAALDQLKIMDVVKGKAGLGGHNKKDMGAHKFWSTQPVPQLNEGPPIDDGYIEPSVPHDQVRQEAYPLPKEYEWSTVDIREPEQSKEVYNLLSLHYVEDDDASFRFQYSAEFLQWALQAPGYHKEWHVGVRVASTKKLVAFISGVPMTLRVRGKTFIASEINWLCIHKKLRSKRLAPVLIKEVTRQVHLKGIFQAIYTAGVVIPTPITTCRYHHRSLNIPKLVEVRFTHVPRSMTLARMIRLHQVDNKPSLKGLREVEEKDVVGLAELYTRFMSRYDMWPVMTLEEITHNFVSGKGRGKLGAEAGRPGRRQGQVTWTYVLEDPQTHKITDFFSFYTLPSTIINSPRHGVLDAAYLYYYATDIAFSQDEAALKARVSTLISNALVIANNAKFDVFNALTLMDNVEVLKDLKFGPGDGYLNYYLYNWRTAPLAGMNPGEDGRPAGKGVGVVML